MLSTDSFLTYENIKVGGLYNFVIFFNNILVKQDICVCVYSRPNGWTNWAEIFCGHSLVAGGCLRLKKSKKNFF